MTELACIPLEQSRGVSVIQSVEMIEAFTDFETANQYQVYDERGDFVLAAAEDEGGFLTHLLRQMMSKRRPFTIWVMDARGVLVLELKKSFALYFHEMEVLDGEGNLFGRVRREFSILKRKYTLRSPEDEVIYEVDGAFWKPWTFDIEEKGQRIAQVKKKFSGFLQEAFTDADNFGVEWNEELAVEDRLMLTALVFFLDVLHFDTTSS